MNTTTTSSKAGEESGALVDLQVAESDEHTLISQRAFASLMNGESLHLKSEWKKDKTLHQPVKMLFGVNVLPE